MSGVNSINWARIIAQTVYYFYAYFKLDKDTVSFSNQLEILVMFLQAILQKKWDYQ